MSDLLTVRAAQDRMIDGFQPRPAEIVPLLSAFHRVLASDIFATQDLPPFSNSSMDGYAVKSADLAAAQPNAPVKLRVVAQIPAGSVAEQGISSGETARIMTGAPIPDGADAVVPLEEIQLENIAGVEMVVFSHPTTPGSSIRPRGLDLHAGDPVLAAGSRLRAQDIGLLASLGLATAPVRPQPRIALFSSGDELVQPGNPLGPGQIYDSNAFVLSGLLADEGAEVIHLGTARDDPADVERLLDRALDRQVDAIVTSGGVSVGAFDFVRGAIEKHGDLAFWRVNMRPGKPLAFGSYKSIPLIGLPGNPVSAYVGCAVFILPVVRKLLGLPPLARTLIPVVLAHEVESDGRESYLRVKITDDNGKWVASFPSHQGSGNLFSLVRANALLILPIGVKSLPAGALAFAWKPGAGSGDDSE
jgi:molybdopterin molybdotransferase